MKLDIEAKFVISDQIVSRRVDTEEVLLDLNSGTYFGLNETGTLAWNYFKAGQSLKTVARKLAEQFETEASVIEKDLITLARELIKRGMVSAS